MLRVNIVNLQIKLVLIIFIENLVIPYDHLIFYNTGQNVFFYLHKNLSFSILFSIFTNLLKSVY